MLVLPSFNDGYEKSEYGSMMCKNETNVEIILLVYKVGKKFERSYCLTFNEIPTAHMRGMQERKSLRLRDIFFLSYK